MSTSVRMTLIGLYNYDNTLFDNLTLPTGYDKDTYIESLLLEHGEKPVLYPDFDFMKYSIGAFSRKWALELKKIYEALTADYDPIENYDRHEEWEDHGGTTYGRKDTTTYGKTDTRTQTVDGTSENKVSAFNSSAYEPDSKTIVNDGTNKLEQRGTDSVQASGSDTANSRHEGHIHGNIGVMTAASMVSEVVKQRVDMNLYDVATRLFANELLYQVY